MSNIDPVQAFKELTPDQLLDAVEHCYLLDRNQYADGRILALNSYENRVYQIGVEGSDNIVAKFYRPKRWVDEAILEEHQFTQQLSDAEIPVIPPCYDRNQNSLFHHGPFRLAVYPCRGGRAMELDNPDHLQQMGRFVGRMHAIGSIAPYQFRPTVDIENYLDQPKRYLMDNRFIPVHIEEAYDSLTDVLKNQIEHCYQRAGTIQSVRLHGDFHPSNVLWTDDGPHIVDFDDARNGPAMQDLWMFLSGDREYMTSMLEKLLAGYCEFHAFNVLELHLLEALRTMRIIYHAGWLASRWQDPAFPIAFPWFDTTSYWEQHILSLREQSALLDEAPLEWSH